MTLFLLGLIVGAGIMMITIARMEDDDIEDRAEELFEARAEELVRRWEQQ